MAIILPTDTIGQTWFPYLVSMLHEKFGTYTLPLQTVFNQQTRATPPEYWASDGVHPTPAGHAVIAEQWRRAAHL